MVSLIEPPASPQCLAPLTTQERVRLGQLIRTVERGLSQFLAVGAALLELRSSRLYRDYPGGTLSGTDRCLARDKRRGSRGFAAIPAVREAFERGHISARRADTLLYLPAGEQALELERRLSEARERERRYRVVADAIRRYLDELGGRPVDLHQLSGIIRQALK